MHDHFCRLDKNGAKLIYEICQESLLMFKLILQGIWGYFEGVVIENGASHHDALFVIILM